ncbi:PD-(D/E)XK nuclease-like domain-containing protein [Vibrio tubiashii]|uniref:PD-(D/E)XK nuclease-like domain-containing protein n=1 Tax=Vibrio tubiashii TaxID=29498 RepID=UPI001EFED18B|nr:PD-(D/E)XK nuclease-like domain-containing protein [Vibrio tubiashii]MCG9575373.1 PD-(D/E)XK nuclease-like domain-containing protein [Vibrio tubiashii]
MNYQINRTDVSAVANHEGIQPILKTQTGLIAKMSDADYFQFQAHSKHSISPAIKSGVDYEFFTIEQRGKKKSDGMDDGKLLHCLLLERSEFHKRYMVSANHVDVHKDNPHFFETADNLKSWVTAHNRKHSDTTKALKALVKKFNSELKDGATQDKISDYEKLPAKAQTAVPTTAAQQKLVKQVLSSLLLEIDTNQSLEKQKEQVRHIATMFEAEIRKVLGESFSTFVNSDITKKVELLNTMLPNLRSVFAEWSSETQLEQLPSHLVLGSLSKAAKDRAIKAYNNSTKESATCMKIDEQGSLEDMFSALKGAGYAERLSEIDSKFFSKILTVGGKKSDTEKYSIEEVLQSIKTTITGSSPVYLGKLVEDEEKKAAANNQVLISSKQYVHACRIVDTALAHPQASKFLTCEGNHYEVAMFWNEELEHDALSVLPDANHEACNGDLSKRKVLCKAKADILNLDLNFIADPKFVSTAEFNALERDSSKFLYHMQDGFYRKGFDKILSSLPTGAQSLTVFPFIFIEKDAPKLGEEEVKPIRVRVEFFKPSHYERAQRMAEQAMTLIECWVSNDRFSGFETTKGMDVPVYQVRAEQNWLAESDAELNKLATGKQGNSQQVPLDTNSANEASSATTMPAFSTLLKAG